MSGRCSCQAGKPDLRDCDLLYTGRSRYSPGMNASLKPRFSLRTMLVVVVIVAYFCMIGAWIYDGLPVKAKLGRLSPGMTTAEVKEILGQPVIVERTIGTQRQGWIYNGWEVYFENDRYVEATPFP
jgi:hypothetical protein